MQHEPRSATVGDSVGDHCDPAPLALAPHPAPGEGVGARVRALAGEWGDVLAIAVASRIGILAAGLLAGYVARSRDLGSFVPFARSGTYIHYADVVRNGYTIENATEFPLLPSVMAAGDALGLPLSVTAIMFSNACFVVGLLLFAMLGARYVGAPAARAAAACLALFPASHFFSIASTESVMLATMCGAVLLALRGTARSWLAAAPLAMACALARPPGALIGLVLLAVAIGQLRSGVLRGPRIAAALACGASIPVAVLAFFAYLGAVTGDWRASIHAQERFGRSLSLAGPWQALRDGVRDVVVAGEAGIAFELVAAALIVLGIAWYARSATGDRWEVRGWTAFAAASLLLPLATGIVWQLPRFALLIPPVFWMLGRLGTRHPLLHSGLMVLMPMALAFKVVFDVVGVSR